MTRVQSNGAEIERRLKTPAACSSIGLGEETARHVAHHQPQPACALVEEM